MRVLLDYKGVYAGYGASQILFGLDLSIREGEMMTLLGRNGMGKSTTVKTLIGAIPIRAGQIFFEQKPLHKLAPDARARLGIAVVPEGRMCFPNLTVHEHLIAFAAQRNNSAASWDVQRLYQLFPKLKERSQNMGNQLSGGEQQMLAIARALSTNPKLLILDEATEGLAPVIRDEIWQCLAQLKTSGQTILIIDKYIEKLLALADRHIILERGQIVWRGNSEQLAQSRSVWSRYLGVAG